MGDQPTNPPPMPPTPFNTDDRAGAAVAPTVVRSIANAPPAQPEPQTPARAKELGSTSVSEKAAVQEVTTGAAAIEQEPIPEDVEAWMQKVGQDAAGEGLKNLPPVQVSAPAPKPVTSGKPMFVLPLGEQEIDQGLKSSVNDSIKWLATWCKRVVKQLRGQVVYGSTH